MSRALEVPLPERQGHRMLVGPFQGPTELLRALLGAGAGLLLALAVGPVEGLLLAGAFLGLNLVRWRDEALWDLLRDALSYQLRQALTSRRTPPVALGVDTDLLVDPEGGRWAAWEAPLLPLSGHDAGDLFTEAKQLLAALPAGWGEVFLLRRAVPWTAVLPSRPPRPAGERLAWEGYRTLLRELTRNCYRHRLFVLVPARSLAPPTNSDGPAPFHPPAGWTRVRDADLGTVARWDGPIAPPEPVRLPPRRPPSPRRGTRSGLGPATLPR
jgi:hypothetical protein